MTACAALAALRPVPKPGGDGSGFDYAAARCWCSWNSFYGGAMFGALIAAMEQATQQPLLSASAQFLSLVVENDALGIRVDRMAAGKSVSQARAAATKRGEAMASASGVLGRFAAAEVPGAMPRVPPPSACPLRESLNPVRGGLNDTLEARVAAVEPPRVRYWVRCPSAAGRPMSAPVLAALSDYPPPAVTVLLGGGAFGVTLDATLRVTASVERHDAGAWTLVDVHFDALLGDFAFATVRIWTETGEMLGIGTQAMRVRRAPNAGKA